MASPSVDRFRVVCEDELFEAEITDALKSRLESTFFGPAFDEGSAQLFDRDSERDAIKVESVELAVFRQIWDYLVFERAPLINSAGDYRRLLIAADFLCVSGLPDLRKAPHFYTGTSVLTHPDWSGPLGGRHQEIACLALQDGAEITHVTRAV